MKSTIEELQNRCDLSGHKYYQLNIYDDASEIGRKWKQQYKELVSSKDNITKCVDILKEQATFIESINRNILIHGLLEKDFEKIIKVDNYGEYIRYFIKGKDRSRNYFNDCDMFAGGSKVYRGLTNLNLVNTSEDYLDDLRNSFRNVTAHNTKTIYYSEIGKNEDEIYSEIVRIFERLTNYLVINNLIDKQFVDDAKNSVLVKPGDKLQYGKYIVEKLISDKGGSSLVYLGKQSKLNNRKVAIKEYRIGVFENSEQYEAVIHSEICNLDELSKGCLYIPNIIDRFYENGTNYVVMDYVPGITIDDFLNKYILTFDQVVKILKGLANILLYLNQNNVAYNDLKSDNILISNDLKVYLIDLATEGIPTEYKRGAFRKEIVEYGKLINRISYKAKIKESEREFLKALSDKCLIDDEFQYIPAIIDYLNKSVIKVTFASKLKNFWSKPKNRWISLLTVAVVALLIYVTIYFLVGPPSYVREIKNGTVGLVIDSYRTNGKDCLELDVAVVNRTLEYIKKGDKVHIRLSFIEDDGAKTKINYSFRADSDIGHDEMKKYIFSITKQEFPDKYHVILGGFKTISIDDIYVESY